MSAYSPLSTATQSSRGSPWGMSSLNLLSPLSGVLSPLSPKLSPSKAYTSLAEPLIDLGRGVFWHCSAEVSADGRLQPSELQVLAGQVARFSEKHAYLEASKGQVAEVLQGSSPSGAVRVLFPEAMAELDNCIWDGDGHFDMTTYLSGPPTLGQIVSFLHMVDSSAEQARVTLHLSSGGRRNTGAVLAGAVLVLARGKSAEAAWAQIVCGGQPPSADPKTAWDRFPRPFVKEGVDTTASSLTVLDCLSGLEAARNLNWMADYKTFDVDSWRLLRQKFDATWIIPNEILAMGHPWTTAQNPRFPGLLDCCEPSQKPSGRPVLMRANLDSATEIGNSLDSPSGSSPSMPRSRAPSGASLNSMDNDLIDLPDVENPEFELVGLESDKQRALPLPALFERYVSESEVANRPAYLAPEAVETEILEAGDVDVPDSSNYVEYLHRKDVGTVMRLNHTFECPEECESTAKFREFGLTYEEFPFNDGDVPSKQLARNFVTTCRKAVQESGKGVAVHCMAGLGRTGVMVGTYAVTRYSINGKAFHGWCRLCRPGSVQTGRQEVFLRHLKPPSNLIHKVLSAGQMAMRKVSSMGSVVSASSSCTVSL
ncbi:unnamed protein product [Polarella glacialis]|uniref:protein-tyrosine-phosphatase n=1 Tax=Polarella glacialis TaxID=89957 RepID=A0A813EUI4_POLGL|nr:unnamed protein product [Polarella glacialis]